MPFFDGSENVDIRGGEFIDIGGSVSKYDHSKHTHYVNSRNTTKSTMMDSFNNSSIRKEGMLSLIYLRLRFNTDSACSNWPVSWRRSVS